MCCRVLLVFIVLTCTFQSEIKAESDDVMCVLLLSGLQKDDLDGTLLKKLQKHNVNMDDLQKKKAIECAMKAISEIPKSDLSTLTEQLLQKHSDKYEETSPLMHNESHNVTEATRATQIFHENDANVNITNITYTNRRQITNNNSVLFSMENVMNLWRMINTAKPLDDNQNVKVSRKHLIVDMPINTNKNTVKIDSQQKESDIHKMIEMFNLAKRTETTRKPTTLIHMDIISRQIQKFLESNNNDYKNLINRLSALNNNSSTQNLYEDRQQARKSLLMKYINELLNHRDNDKKMDPSESHIEYPYVPQEEYTMKPLADNIIKEITEQVRKTLLKDLKEQLASTTLDTTEESTTVTTTTTHKTPRDNSRKQNEADIFEKIKVLFQELKKETTEQQTGTTTDITTTVLQIANDNIKDASNVLEKFIELFKQYRQVRDSIEPATMYKLTTKKSKVSQAQGPSNVVFSPLTSLNNAVHVQTQPQVNKYPNFLQMSHPIVEKTNTYQRVQQERYTIKGPFEAVKLSEFYRNPVNNLKSQIGELHVLQVAPIIQTDAIEVPPLGIPVPNSVNVLNTNIVVTTQHPMVQYREEYQHHYTKDPSRYLDYLIRNEGRSTNGRSEGRSYGDLVKTSDTDSNFKYHTDMERNYEVGNVYAQHGILPQSKRFPRIRQSPDVDRFYRDYISKLKHGDPVHSWDRNRENYHGKLDRALEQRDMRGHDRNLEGPDLWQREIREREKKLQRPDLWERDYRNDKKIERPRHARVRDKARETNNRQKIAPRQQMSIHELKKKARYDDTHFQNFLKTQQKVNEMLENILATKGPDRIRSVETP